MSGDLSRRVAAAQAAADADKPERCEWCGATDDEQRLTLAHYEHHGSVMECENESMCRARCETQRNTAALPVSGSHGTQLGLDGRETPRTAPPAPEIGGELARQCGYSCVDCGQQIISSIPVERCDLCHHTPRESHDAAPLFDGGAFAGIRGQLAMTEVEGT